MSTQQNNPSQEEEALKSQEEVTEEAQTAQADASEENAEAEDPQAKELAEAKQALADMKDKYLRTAAEFDNYRKRTIKEKAELIKNGGEKTISAILPVIDDFERAIDNMGKTADSEAVRQGIELIYQKFLKTLSQQGLEKMNPVGQAFDTDYHEAIALIPAADDSQKGKVIDCVQTGYKLNDKVIRHAKVVVAQ